MLFPSLPLTPAKPLGINRCLLGTRSFQMYESSELIGFYYPLANVTSFIGDDGLKRAIRWPYLNGEVNEKSGGAICNLIVNANEGITFPEQLSAEQIVALAARYYPTDHKLQFMIGCAYKHEVLKMNDSVSAQGSYMTYTKWMHDIKDSVIRQNMDKQYGDALKRAADMEHQNELAERI